MPFDEACAAAITGFKATATKNVTKAVNDFARDTASEVFACGETSVWPSNDPALGWSYFFGTSIHMSRAIGPRKALALFYHTWSDVVLLTEWAQETEGGPAQMTEAIMLMGDFFRHRGKPPFDTIPRFARSNVPAVLGAGMSGALTAKVFQEVCLDIEHNPDRRAQWRSAFLEGDNTEMLAINRVGVAVLLKRCLASLERYFRAPELQCFRSKAAATLMYLQSGASELVMQEASVTPELMEFLGSIGKGVWGEMSVVCYVDSGKTGTVFLAPQSDPSFYTGLLLAHGEAPDRMEKHKGLLAGEGAVPESRLVRVDAFSVSVLYDRYDEFAKMLQDDAGGQGPKAR
ncbi:MAG: hypothetical protein IT577_22685 [Verrucomicrobiae bacterium]|nr:hypothetical protein [Verrucomicrobiae bacterium]